MGRFFAVIARSSNYVRKPVEGIYNKNDLNIMNTIVRLCVNLVYNCISFFLHVLHDQAVKTTVYRVPEQASYITKTFMSPFLIWHTSVS